MIATLVDWILFCLIGLPVAFLRILCRFAIGGWRLGDYLYEMWFSK